MLNGQSLGTPCDLLGEKVITAGILSQNCIKLFFVFVEIVDEYALNRE